MPFRSHCHLISQTEICARKLHLTKHSYSSRKSKEIKKYAPTSITIQLYPSFKNADDSVGEALLTTKAVKKPMRVCKTNLLHSYLDKMQNYLVITQRNL